MPIVLKALAPKEAVDYLVRRGADLRPSWGWQEVWQEEHARAFAVARMTQLDLLQEVHRQVQAAVEEGVTLDEFKKRLVPKLQKAGWWGAKKVDGDVVRLGSPERLRTIYDTNVRQAFAAGAWERFERTKADLPYLLYGLGPSRRHRVQHAAWEGIILPVDHPWWNVHAPVNGWGCKCWLRALTAREAERLGYDPAWTPPEDRMIGHTLPNGETVQVPEGIDPGFAYNPGKPGVRSAQLGQVLSDKLQAADAPVAAAAVQAGTKDLVPALQAAYGSWIDDLVEGKLVLQGRRLAVGAVSPRVLDQVAQLRGEPLQSAAITMEDRELNHMYREAKQARGAALSEADLRRIPEHLAEPKAVLWDLADPALVYVFDPAEGAVGKVVVRVDHQVQVRPAGGKKVRLVTNTIRTAGLVQPGNLTTDRYQLLDGSI